MRTLISATSILLLLGIGCGEEVSSPAGPDVDQADQGDGQCSSDGAPCQYRLAVQLADGLNAGLEVTYQATRDSFLCTDLVFDGLSPKRVPEQHSVVVDPTDGVDDATGERIREFTFSHDAGDGCDSIVRHINIVPTDDAEQLEPFAFLALESSEDYDNEVQEVSCKITQSLEPGSSAQIVDCGNDLLSHTTDGRARVRLAL